MAAVLAVAAAILFAVGTVLQQRAAMESAFAKVGILFASVEGFLNVPVVGGLLVPPIRSAGEPERRQPATATSAGGGP